MVIDLFLSILVNIVFYLDIGLDLLWLFMILKAISVIFTL